LHFGSDWTMGGGQGRVVSASGDDCWAVAGDSLWDGVGDVHQGLCVVVCVDKIVSICPVGEALRRGVPVEVHEGCCLMPGLIDAHVHMGFSGDYPLHDQPPLTRSELRAAMADRAYSMTRRGITAARDLGSTREFHPLWLRDEILAGRLVGPRLVCAGQPLTVPQGHCHQWGGAVSSFCEIRPMVKRQADRGVDWIKVMATGGIRTPGSRPDQAQFSTEELVEVVHAAAEHGLSVAAHAHATVGIKSAVAAGCRTIEHVSWIGPAGWATSVDDDAIAEMARKGIRVSPTAHANWSRWPKDGSQYRKTSGALRRLQVAGVGIVCSSDCGAIPGLQHDQLWGAVRVLSDMANMSPVQALKAATSLSAEAIGLDGETGRLHLGLSADLLLVPGDPFTDLGVLRHPVLVVARGVRVDPKSPLPVHAKL